MTLAEFIAPLKTGPRRDTCLAAIYYYDAHHKKEGVSVEELRQLLVSARVPLARKFHLADILSKAAEFVDAGPKTQGRFSWKLTKTGREHVRKLLGLNETELDVEKDVVTLNSLLTRIQDDDVRDYVKEGISCLRVSAYRASVVFIWTAAIRNIQQRLLSERSSQINLSLKRFDNNARTVKNLEDFSYIKEKTVLQVAKDLNVFDKAQTAQLEAALGLRNYCGHPAKYSPGEKKVSAFIEDIVAIVFSQIPEPREEGPPQHASV